MKNSDYVRCPNCDRVVPNDSFFTKDKCKWCDTAYWRKKNVKK